MSHRKLTKDPVLSRREAYKQLEKEGKSQEAMWEALAALKAGGQNLGEKADQILQEREAIKAARPK